MATVVGCCNHGDDGLVRMRTSLSVLLNTPTEKRQRRNECNGGGGGNHVGTRRSVGLYSEAGCVLCAMTVADPGGGGFGEATKPHSPPPPRRSVNVGEEKDSMFLPLPHPTRHVFVDPLLDIRTLCIVNPSLCATPRTVDILSPGCCRLS